MKVCKHCQEDKDESEYGISHKVGDIVHYRNVCKSCRNKQTAKPGVFQKPTTKSCSVCKIEKEITLENFGQHTIKGRKYFRSTCIQCRREAEIKRREANPEKKREADTQYYEANKSKIIAKQIEKVRNDPNLRFIVNLRSRIRDALKAKKTKRTIEYLGCTFEFLKLWIESQFDEHMNWDNIGTYWHLDHVIPVAFFKLTNEAEIAICFHWTNLRPLEKITNIKKSDKIIPSYIINHITKLLDFLTSSSVYQTNTENCWWRRLKLRYDENPKDGAEFTKLLKWAIRIEDASTSTADIADALASLTVAE